MTVLAITDELQSLQLSSKSAFAENPFTEAQSFVTSKLGATDGFQPNRDILDSLGKASQAMPGQGQIPQPPLSVAELQSQVTGRLEPLSNINIDTLTKAIPATPGVAVFKDLDITASVNQAVSALGAAITGNDNFGKLNVGISGTLIPAEFNEFLRGSQAFPARLLDALLAVFKELLDKLAHPEKLLESLSTEALTEIFVEQIKGVTATLPPVAIRLGGEAIQSRGKQAEDLSTLLKNLKVDQLNRDTISKLRKQINGMVIKLEENERTLERSASSVKDFNLEAFNELLQQLPQGNGGQINVLTNLFNQAEGFVSSLSKRMTDVTTHIQTLIEQVKGFIQQAIGQVGAVADQIIQAIKDQLTAAGRALEQVQDYLSKAIETLQSFVDQACQKIQDIVNPVKESFNQVATQTVGQIEALSETVKNQINSLNNSVQDVQKNIDEKLNRKKLEHDIQELLKQVTGVLNSPQVESAIKTADQGIEQMLEALKTVSLKPPFDTAVTKTKTLETDLRGMNVATMGTAQKAALKVGIKILQQVDVPGVVNPELTAAFDEVLNPVVKIVNRAQTEVNQVSSQIQTFQPGTLIKEYLGNYIEDLVTKLDEYQPSALLAPVKALYNDLMDKLTVLDPAKLLTLLENLYQKLLEVLEALSPTGLTNFLKTQIERITKALENLPVEKLVGDITATLGNAEQIFAGLGLDEVLNAKFWKNLKDILSIDIKQQINQISTLKVKITSRVNQVDEAQITAALKDLRTAIKTFSAGPSADYQEASEALTTAWKSHQAAITALNTTWQEVSPDLNAFAPGPEFQVDYADLKSRLADLHQRLTQADGVPQHEPIREAAELGAGNSETDEAMRLRPTDKHLQTVGILATINTRENAQIMADFKQVIPNELEQQLFGPVQRILTSLDTMLTQPHKVLPGIEAVIEDLTELPKKVFTILKNMALSIGGQIGDSITLLSNTIKTFNVNFINDLHLKIVNQVEELRPVYLLNRFYNLSDFKESDLSTLRTKLRSPSPDLVSRFFLDQLTENQRNLVLGGQGDQIQDIVIEAFNKLLENSQFYSAERFQGISLQPQATDLITRRANLNSKEQIRLNRLLLEAAYPDALVLSMQSLFPFFLETLKELYPKELVQSLDDLHGQIVQVVRDLPASLADALNAEYNEVMELFERAIQEPIDRIFAALIARLRGLQSELGIGLEDISSAYNRLLVAVPV